VTLNKFIVLLCWIVFAAHATTLPNWFYSLKPGSANEIIGYGTAASLEEARKNALAEVSDTLLVGIKSELNLTQTYKNNELVTDYDAKLTSNSAATLSGVNVIKSELIEGTWYVAVSFDNSPLSLKIKNADLKQAPDSPRSNDDIYRRSPLILELDQALGKKHLYKLRRDNQLWYLQVADQSFTLKANELKQFFHSHTTKQLQLKLNKGVYNSGDLMSFSISSAKPGFVSILYAEASGKSGVIMSNKKITETLNFPSKADEDELMISNPTGSTLSEMYIAIWSESPVSLDQLYPVTSDYLDESAFNLHDVFELLSKHRYTSKVIKIN
jgi:hypothetical protein